MLCTLVTEEAFNFVYTLFQKLKENILRDEQVERITGEQMYSEDYKCIRHCK